MKVTPFRSSTTPYRIQLPGRYSADGRRKSKYFQTLGEAEKFLSHVKKFGLPKPEIPRPSLMVSDRLRSVIDHILQTLGDDPARLYEAVEHYRKTKLNFKVISLGDARELYLAERANDPARTIETIKGDLRKLCAQIVPAVELGAITDDMVRGAIEAQSDGTKRNVYKTSNRFFNWAVEKKYLAESPMAHIRPIGKFGANKEYYEVATYTRILRIAAGLEPVRPGGTISREYVHLLPWLVLGGFGGLRACELIQRSNLDEVIRWDDLHFGQEFEIPFVEVRDEVAKQTETEDSHLRHVDAGYAIEALQDWLPLCPRNGPFICSVTERQLLKLKNKFTAETGLKFAENGLRNSFATYSLAHSGLSGLGHVAKQLGNSEAIARRHYARSLPTGTGRAWFAIRPFQAVQSQVA